MKFSNRMPQHERIDEITHGRYMKFVYHNIMYRDCPSLVWKSMFEGKINIEDARIRSVGMEECSRIANGQYMEMLDENR